MNPAGLLILAQRECTCQFFLLLFLLSIPFFFFSFFPSSLSAIRYRLNRYLSCYFNIDPEEGPNIRTPSPNFFLLASFYLCISWPLSYLVIFTTENKDQQQEKREREEMIIITKYISREERERQISAHSSIQYSVGGNSSRNSISSLSAVSCFVSVFYEMQKYIYTHTKNKVE